MLDNPTRTNATGIVRKDGIADVVLRYRPKDKGRSAEKKRKRLARKEKEDAGE